MRNMCAVVSMISFVGFCFLTIAGCESSDNGRVQPANAPLVEPRTLPYQRFVPINYAPANLSGVPWSGAFALDTKTGNLCRTYDWEYGNPTNILNQLPLCNALFHAEPDK
jgi:hypothetical protein